MSLGIEKLHRLCKALHNIAALYVKAKGQQQQDQELSMVGNDFDIYLSQLGFISPRHADENTATDGAMGSVSDPDGSQPFRLGDWFSGNLSVMDLMEEDFLNFDSDLPSITE